jgi:hypothetical protein
VAESRANPLDIFFLVIAFKNFQIMAFLYVTGFAGSSIAIGDTVPMTPPAAVMMMMR